MSAIRSDHYYSDLEVRFKDFIIAGSITDPLSAVRATKAPLSLFIISGEDQQTEIFFPHVRISLISSGTEPLGAGYTAGGAMQNWSRVTIQILISAKLGRHLNEIGDEITDYVLSTLKTLKDNYLLNYRGMSDYRLPFDTRAKVIRRSLDFSFNYFDIRTT